MPCLNACSTIALIGAKPVPLATNTIGLSLSRRKNVPSGPSKRRMSRSFIVFEHVVGERAAGHVAHVDLQELVVVRRVRHREAAPRAVLQEELDVLPGKELQALVRRQLEVHDHHVVGDALELVHAAGQDLDRRCP